MPTQEGKHMLGEIRIEKGLNPSDNDTAELRLAKIIAELIRQGVSFTTTECNQHYTVEIDGGFSS